MRRANKNITLSQKPLPQIFNFSVKLKILILAFVSICLYANTLFNDYALDDEALIQKNEYVQKGISGIGKILTKDAYDSYYRQNNANQYLAGGRYRPLSIVLFAIEHSLFGESPLTGHLINILLYAACVLVMFYFLRKILLKKLRYGGDIAFLSCLFFAVHPIHTEVVANIKSSDEILSLLFIAITLILGIRYIENKKIIYLIGGLVSFFFALLSKEYAITLVILFPILYCLYFNKKVSDSIVFMLPYLGILILYLFIRFKAVGTFHHHELDILNDPYKYASFGQKLATEIYVSGRYLFMLFVPYPLASDYGFAQIPLYNFANPFVWLSLLFYVAIIGAGIKLFQKKNMLAFPVFFFLFNLFMVSNFLLNIGTTMNERLIFHSSLGFCVMLSYGLFELKKRCGPLQVKIGATIIGIVVVLCATETVQRNMDWKNNYTLFTKDVITVPNSVKANDNAGAQYINKSEATTDSLLSDQYVKKGLSYLYKSVQLDDSDIDGYLNLGIAYCKLDVPDSCRKYWTIARRLYPAGPTLPGFFNILGKMYLAQGEQELKEGKMNNSLKSMEIGMESDPSNPDIPFNLGGTFFNIQLIDSARYYWNKTAQLNPNYPELQKWLKVVSPSAPNP